MGSRVILAVMAVVVGMAGPQAFAVEPFTPPDWIRRPTGEDVLAAFPPGALRRGLDGRATLSCRVSLVGALSDCKVVSETPPGEGFAAAALALTPQFLLKPATRNGVPEVFSVQIPIFFDAGAIPTGSHLRGAGTLAPILSKVVSNLPWQVAPTYDQVVAAYPEKARAKGVGGHAALICGVRADRRLGRCSMLDEQPRGYGFGAAARTLMASFIAPDPASGQDFTGMDAQVAVTFDPRMLTPSRPIFGKPQWAALPQPTDFAATFPKAARTAGVMNARVVVSCGVGPAGALTGCGAISEEPPALGFGAAALALTPAFRLNVWTAEGGSTVGGRVNVPIRYESSPAKP